MQPSIIEPWRAWSFSFNRSARAAITFQVILQLKRNDTMKAFMIPTAVVLVMAAAAVQAHAQLKQSTPAEGAVVTEMPAAIDLTFSESARVTAVSIQKDQEPKQKLKAPRGAAAEHISVAVSKLAPGSYTLTWRAVSEDDGHIMSGELHFKVAAMTMRMDKPTKP